MFGPHAPLGDRRRTFGVAEGVEGRRPSRVDQGRRLLGCAIVSRGMELAQVDLRSAPASSHSVHPRGRERDDIAEAG
jgi:hypothetical protein